MTCVILNVKGTLCRTRLGGRTRGQLASGQSRQSSADRDGCSRPDPPRRSRRPGRRGSDARGRSYPRRLLPALRFPRRPSRRGGRGGASARLKASRSGGAPGGPEALAATIDVYLSPLHRDKSETGCAVAALPTDIARSSQRARAAYTAQVRRYLDLLAGLTPAGEPDDPPSSWRRWSERSRWLVPSTIPGSPTRSWSGSPECCTATFKASAHRCQPDPQGHWTGACRHPGDTGRCSGSRRHPQAGRANQPRLTWAPARAPSPRQSGPPRSCPSLPRK